MNHIERVKLIKNIARELQARMTYDEIDMYLSGFGIDISMGDLNINSKYVYSKRILANTEQSIIIRIASELGVEHTFIEDNPDVAGETNFWRPNHFRLFLSHLASDKVKISYLQKALFEYGISSFVAHEDIEPTKEWLSEIEKALFSMDALVAILSPGFNESNWTDHEVGIAIGRNCLVIPIRKGIDPYGFIGKFQGFQGEGKTIKGVADGIFSILINHSKTMALMSDALSNLILSSNDSNSAFAYLTLIKKIQGIPIETIKKIHNNIIHNKIFMKDEDFLFELNKLFFVHGMDIISQKSFTKHETIDDMVSF